MRVASSVLTTQTRPCITVGAGGFLGMYMMGSMCFIKDRHDLSAMRIGGVSAGAAVALYGLSNRTDASFVFDTIIRPLVVDEEDQDDPQTSKRPWRKLTHKLGECIYKLEDYVDRDRMFVSVSQLNLRPPFRPSVSGHVIEHFETFEDMVKYVKMSCHVPVLGGRMVVPYNDALYFDGVFTNNNPVPQGCHQVLYITASMWGRTFGVRDCVNSDPLHALQLFVDGYQDAWASREHLCHVPSLPRPVARRNTRESVKLIRVMQTEMKRIRGRRTPEAPAE